MNKNILLGTGAIAFIAVIIFQLTPQSNQANETLPIVSTPNIDNGGITVTQQQKTVTSSSSIESNKPNEKVTDQKKTQTETAKLQLKIDEFLASSAFDTPSNFDDAFISATNVVSSSTLKTVIAAKDFSKIIDKVNLLDKDHESVQREELLYKEFSDLIGDKFYSENFTCSGKVCLIEFNYDETQTTEKQLHQIRSFSKNHSFSSFSPSNNDDMVYRGIYIATDDPSKLTMSRE